jgi:tight adherence protein C
LPVPWLLAVALLAVATPWTLAVFVTGGMISLAAPWVWLQGAIRRRRFSVLRELPLHLDLLALALESGASLLLALRTSLPRAPDGPFRDALTGLLGDLQTGRTRIEAIQALQRRVDFECVQPLTTAMIQAERSGAGLAELLRLQSEQRSHERFHRAEQLAMQAPVKMLGPLVLCIFPGTFIVLAFVVFARASG